MVQPASSSEEIRRCVSTCDSSKKFASVAALLVAFERHSLTFERDYCQCYVTFTLEASGQTAHGAQDAGAL